MKKIRLRIEKRSVKNGGQKYNNFVLCHGCAGFIAFILAST